MKFAVGCDHAAVELKKAMLEVLDELKVEYYDFGVGENEKCDYPDMAKAVCEKVASGEYDRGMLLCGTQSHSFGDPMIQILKGVPQKRRHKLFCDLLNNLFSILVQV